MTSSALKLVAAGCAAASLITFVAYGWDKRRAARGGWRTREATLHWLEFLGGWPGALVGQNVFRHKRAKLRYMLAYWGIVAAHVAGWAAARWRGWV